MMRINCRNECCEKVTSDEVLAFGVFRSRLKPADRQESRVMVYLVVWTRLAAWSISLVVVVALLVLSLA